MNSLFYNCSSLKELNLSSFNTNKVTNIDNMFNGYSSFKELNISNFNTENKPKVEGILEGSHTLIII